jgi:hypothetical protein
MLLLALLLILYYRRQNQRMRHHSDLDLKDMLSEPLLGESLPKERGTAVEMVTSMWKDTSSTTTIQQPWQINFAKLNLGKRIGAGAYGMVFEGVYNEGRQPVAIKRLLLSIHEEARATEIKSAQSEMKILWELRHPV